MTETKYYLKQNVVIEPLIWSWYAHPFLLAPGTTGLYIRDKIRLMRSFLDAPHLHEMASLDRELAGGMFLNMPAAKADLIAALLENTIKENEKQVEFADGITSLYNLLLKEGKGFSLEGLYKNVPDILKGFVELLYDVNNQPGFRFFESLLYKDNHKNYRGQSLFFCEIDIESRGYIADMPRLNDINSYEMQIPFSSDAIDHIARLRELPESASVIKSLFQHDFAPHFDRLTTTDAPFKSPQFNYAGPGIRIRYYGHACVLLQTENISILIDPFICYYSDQSNSNFSFADLPHTIDYVLITHSHVDHIIPEYLLQLRYKIKNIVVPTNGNGNLEDPSLKLLLESIGFKNVIELNELESIKIPDGEIIGMPFLGEHCDLNIHSKILHLVRLYNKSILLASDSSNLEIQVYKILKEIVGGVDIVFLGMESEGAPLSLNYGPLMTKELNRKMDQSRRVNGSDFNSGYAIVKEFKPREVYIYAMGLEPWTRYILGIQYTEEAVQLKEADKLISSCIQDGIHAELLQYKKELIVMP